ncbi:MAG: abortive infection system antitoxin AbiGi family protein [Desulfobacteria bacterium]
MPAIADNLIHFLGRLHKESPHKQLEIFKSIIHKGLRCGKIQIKFSEGAAVHNQVVCFSDIPLSLCDEHAAIYGKFGIGFKKSFVKKHGGNPARYFVDYLPGETLDDTRIENRGLLYMNLCRHFKLIKQLRDTLRADANYALYDVKGNEIYSHKMLDSWSSEQLAALSFEKETGDLGPARDETKDTDLYYKEREWRLVPFNANITSGSVEIDSNGLYQYKFKRIDVNVVVTPNDEIRNEVLRFLIALESEKDTRLKEFGENPLPVITYDDLHKW